MSLPGVAADAATNIVNLPYCRVMSASGLADGRSLYTSYSSCGPVVLQRKKRRCQRIPDIHAAGDIEVIWSKQRWYWEEQVCARQSFFESTTQVARHARSAGRLRDHVADSVIRSGRVSETPAAFAKWQRQAVRGGHFLDALRHAAEDPL